MDYKFILFFTLIQLLNVILSTVKSILTVRGSKLTAAVSNALYYGYYTIVIIYTAGGVEDLLAKVIITTLTNLIGVYLGLTALEKLRKNRLWEITATVYNWEADSFEVDLQEHNISYNSNNLNNSKRTLFRIYSRNKEESETIKGIFSKYKNIKYIVHEETVRF